LRERSFNELVHRYTEPHRAYHTLEHVSALLDLWMRYGALVSDLQSVGLAIWFHDAIYNPRRPGNELKSAKLSSRHLQRMGAPHKLQKRVFELVLATAGHQAAANDGDALFFLDCDLSILGAPPASYQAYTQKIRQEYYFVPFFLYKKARNRLLQTWQNKQLFQTPELRSVWESQAHVNLAEELRQFS